MDHGPSLIRTCVDQITNPERHALVEWFLEQYEARVCPILPSLRRSVIHNDANDYNVLVCALGKILKEDFVQPPSQKVMSDK